MTEIQSSLTGKNIVLGICSGIAAYKAPYIVRGLTALGAEVQVVLTNNAHRFVSPTALQAVSGNTVRQDLWDESAEAAMGHIELARWADLILIAPTTANTLSQLAQGGAADLLTTLCLATEAPVMLAPAMNQRMYQHAATQANLQTISADLGYQLVGPDSGDQACGDVGPGRMSEPEALVSAVVEQLSPAQGVIQNLTGYTLMVTSGPTVEAIDPVRFISNHSSGLQGLSIAEAASKAGAQVILIAGPGVPNSDVEMQRIDVTTAVQMHDQVHQHIHGVDIFVGVAAVADYRPAEIATQKMKRAGTEDAGINIELVENPDIIASVARLDGTQAPIRPTLVVGFAAETNDTLRHAREKRARKGLDAIVLNDVSDPTIGFNSQQNAATLIYEQGEVDFPRQSKQHLAKHLIQQLPEIFAHQLAGTNPLSVTK